MDKSLPSPQATAKPPSVFARLGAALYDLLLVLAVLFIAAFVFVSLTRHPLMPPLRHWFQLYLLVVIASYFVGFWTFSGQTLAMKTWRLKLVTIEGARLGIARALLRFALAILLWPLSIFWAFFGADRQYLHDKLARTKVVRQT